MSWMTYPWPWPKVTTVASISENVLVCVIKCEPLVVSLQNMAALLPYLSYHLIRFWRSFVGIFDFGICIKFLLCFFKVKHYFGHISGMVGPINVKRKRSASVGYWAQYVTLIFDLTHDLGLGCFKVKFRNSSFSGIVGLIDVKWKRNELIWYWANCMTLPFDHTHHIDIGVEISRVRVWNSFISGMGRLTDMERKGCESSIHDHDVDKCDHGGVGGCSG